MVFRADVEDAVNMLRREIKARTGMTDKEIAVACGIKAQTIRNRATEGRMHSTTAYEMAVQAELIGKRWVLVDEQGNVDNRAVGYDHPGDVRGAERQAHRPDYRTGGNARPREQVV